MLLLIEIAMTAPARVLIRIQTIGTSCRELKGRGVDFFAAAVEF
jgi:hypothetical protein